MLPRKLQRRYRRHLAHFKPLLQITRTRRSLNQLSRLCIHSVQEFHIVRIQSRQNMNETNIVALHDQIPPRISRPSPSFLPSRLHSSRHRSALFFFFFFFRFIIRKMMMQQRMNLFRAFAKMSVSLVLTIFKYFSLVLHFESAHFICTRKEVSTKNANHHYLLVLH